MGSAEKVSGRKGGGFGGRGSTETARRRHRPSSAEHVNGVWLSRSSSPLHFAEGSNPCSHKGITGSLSFVKI